MKSKHTPTAHDAAFKGFMTQVENARDFFDIHLPEHIKSLCDFSRGQFGYRKLLYVRLIF